MLSILALSLLQKALASSAVVVMDKSGSFKDVQSFSSASLIGSMRAMAGFPVDASSAGAVESVLNSDALFARPKTLVSLHVLGLDVQALASSGKVAAYTDGQASFVRSADTMLQLGQKAQVAHGPLDHDALQGCVGQCQEAAMAQALAQAGARLEGNQVVLANGATLNLALPLHKAFVTELTAVYKGFALASARALPQDGRPELYEGILGSLQALRTAKDAAYEGAAEALTTVIRQGLDTLTAAKKDTTALLVLSGDVTAATKPSDMLLLRGAAVSKRRLQVRASNDTSTALTRKQWSDRLGMALALIIFLVGALAGSYSLLYMPFQPDALLFPTKQF